MSYKTIHKPFGPIEYKDKKSRFIAFLEPCNCIETAETIIKKFHRQYHSANHVCFAYRLGEDRQTYYRHADDGEPAGTAGMPIYKEICRFDLLNVILIVIRYFGGIKLGTGGLGRAYAASAKAVLDISEPVIEIIWQDFKILFPFALIGHIRKIIQQFSLQIHDEKYDKNGVVMSLSIPLSSIEEVKQALTTVSSGKISLTK